MFQQITQTAYPPTHRPLLLWDGDCAFCAYWVERWKKMTGSHINYLPYQEAAALFPDIPEHHFKEAVRLIDTAGRVYSGAEAAYRSFAWNKRWKWLYQWYQQSEAFATFSEHSYQFIADNRPALYQVTKAAFGANPKKMKPYWLVWLAGAVGLVWGAKKMLDR